MNFSRLFRCWHVELPRPLDSMGGASVCLSVARRVVGLLWLLSCLTPHWLCWAARPACVELTSPPGVQQSIAISVSVCLLPGGSLVCCDSCPASPHTDCAELPGPPVWSWPAHLGCSRVLLSVCLCVCCQEGRWFAVIPVLPHSTLIVLSCPAHLTAHGTVTTVPQASDRTMETSSGSNSASTGYLLAYLKFFLLSWTAPLLMENKPLSTFCKEDLMKMEGTMMMQKYL